MPDWNGLTAAQRQAVSDNQVLLRPACADLLRLLDTIDKVLLDVDDDGAVSGTVGTYALANNAHTPQPTGLGSNDVVPNTTGLAGTGTINARDYAAVIAFFRRFKNDNGSDAIKVVLARMCGVINVVNPPSGV